MGGRVNIVNLKQKSVLHAQRTSNYDAKLKIKCIKRLTFLQKFTISLLGGRCDHSTPAPRCLSLCLLTRTIYIALSAISRLTRRKEQLCFMNLIREINSFSFYVLHQVGELWTWEKCLLLTLRE